MHEYYSDMECMRFASRRQFDENESWQKVTALSGHWNLRGYDSLQRNGFKITGE